MGDRYDLLLRNADLLIDGQTVRADIGVNGGRIVAIGDLSSSEGGAVHDLTGLMVLPGAIDSHTHMRQPGPTHKEDLESGSRAAVFGGITAFFDMPNTTPNTTDEATLHQKLELAAGRTWCDYAFWIGATTDNLDDLARLEKLPGTPGIKLFMGSSTGTLLVDKPKDVMIVLNNGNRPVAVHSEDEDRLRSASAAAVDPVVSDHPVLRDAEAAVLATRRLIDMCAETRRSVHILHVSTADELPLIADAKRAGIPLTCEITPHHLTFSADDYGRLGTKLQMNPPVRTKEHRAALLSALKSGLFDTAGSDHSPHTLEEKAQTYPKSPSGMPGVQMLLPVMLDLALRGETTLSEVARMVCSGPAKLFGMEGRGLLEVGSRADFSVVDLGGRRTVESDWLQSKAGWAAYEGMELRGNVVRTYVGGKLVMADGELVAQAPTGQPVMFDDRE